MTHVVTIEGVQYARTNGYKSHLSEVMEVSDYPSSGKTTLMYVPAGKMIYSDDKRHPDMKG